MSNVVPAREFWDRKVDSAIVRFYYNGNLPEFVANMVRLGYPAKKIEAIVDNWMEGEDG
jgi:hypothetical protein